MLLFFPCPDEFLIVFTCKSSFANLRLLLSNLDDLACEECNEYLNLQFGTAHTAWLGTQPRPFRDWPGTMQNPSLEKQHRELVRIHQSSALNQSHPELTIP